MQKNNNLLFIDTNIYLDFYKIPTTSYLKRLFHKLTEIADKLLMTEQTHMEILKNRQRMLTQEMEQIDRLFDNQVTILPSFISESKAAIQLKQLLASGESIAEEIKKNYMRVLYNLDEDEVYQSVKAIIEKVQTKFYLPSTEHARDSIAETIEQRANKRFYMGYPPRKQQDTTFTDAINWEWIIYCANQCDKDIVLVTRDTDFGFILEASDDRNQSILNDWLQKEFQVRVSAKKKIHLFNQLTKALSFMGLDIANEDIEIEQEMISS